MGGPFRSPIRPMVKRNQPSSSRVGWSGLLRSLDRDVVDLIGRGLDPDVQAQFLRLLSKPGAAVVVASDPSEGVGAHSKGGAVIEHTARLVADRRIHDLADRQAPHVARQRVLQQRLRVGAGDLEFAQRREVDDDRPLPAGPVLVDGPVVVEGGRQPVAPILGEVPGHFGCARMKRGFAGELHIGIGSHSVCHRF
jgi:hypothetical protein